MARALTPALAGASVPVGRANPSRGRPEAADGNRGEQEGDWRQGGGEWGALPLGWRLLLWVEVISGHGALKREGPECHESPRGCGWGVGRGLSAARALPGQGAVRLSCGWVLDLPRSPLHLSGLWVGGAHLGDGAESLRAGCRVNTDHVMQAPPVTSLHSLVCPEHLRGTLDPTVTLRARGS